MALGLNPWPRTWGVSVCIHIRTDATAAIGACKRRGLGKIRHLATANLWIQEKLRQGLFELIKVPGTANIADMLTTHVDRSTLERHMDGMNLKEEYGRPQSAPTLDQTVLMFIPVTTLSKLAGRC